MEDDIFLNEEPFAAEKKQLEYDKILKAEAEDKKRVKEELENLVAQTEKRLNEIEILPMCQSVLIEQYKKDPYLYIKKSGIILSDDNQRINENTGQMEEVKKQVQIGRIVEIAPDCKFAKVGDEVYYMTFNAIPIPFAYKGLVSLPETRILTIINTGLKERFNDSRKK
jgi:hypothetical protein